MTRLERLKHLLTDNSVNSFAPCVMLPRWKSVIVDYITLFTLGLCRWRWSGVTIDDWYGGFTIVSFIPSEEDNASTDNSTTISASDCDSTE